MTIFYRLLGFLRPYKRGMIISWVLASLAMVMTVALPALTGRAVQIIGTLFSLFNKVGKVVIVVLLLLALFGGWQLYVLKIQGFLDSEANSALTTTQ